MISLIFVPEFVETFTPAFSSVLEIVSAPLLFDMVIHVRGFLLEFCLFWFGFWLLFLVRSAFSRYLIKKPFGYFNFLNAS